ncbi:hypothetical protein GLOIN_2v1772310 [Rhizophagus irregularis DAOM 181602=DAOM 197198]|nr:hypothetical protein GLOIN_2v1772310 [Rhizophagus irregularis DAOM 181602=DAOM 197198]
MGGWKYSKQRLQRHPFVAKVVRAKKVICICGVVIKLNRKYDEDYINHHANGPGCKRNEQKSILCFFNPTTTDKKDDDDVNSDDDWNDWKSEVEDAMDDNDIITVDENEDGINEKENANIEIINPATNQTGRKRKPCLGLRSDLIAKYVDRTPACYGGARRVEIIAKEIYPGKFPHKFTRKKLKPFQKRALNRKIYAESQWRVDKDCIAVRAKECTGYSDSGKTICNECYLLKYNPILAHRLTIPKPAPENLKFTPKFYFENNSLKKHLQNQDLHKIWSVIKDNYDTSIWITLADKATNGAFKEKPVFTGLYEVMVQAAIRKDNNKGKQNIQYNEDFTNFLIILGSFNTLTNPNLSFENVAKFKRLIDTLNYRGPIVAMSDNTKLKPALRYNPVLGCIVGSTLSTEQTKINKYEDIQPIINNIKTKKAIAKDVRAYILQIPLPNFPPVVIALIANNGSDNMSTITSFHQELLTQIAPQLNLPILSIGSDGAIVEFKAQVAIQSYSTDERLTFKNNKLGVDFSCPIFPNVGPVIRVQDPKHAKKTSRNAIMSGARLLTLGSSTARFEQLLKLSNLSNSVMYHHDVIKLDRQDDGAAYRVFCSENLRNCHGTHNIEEDMRGLFVYLFIMGELIDSYLNREITPLERIRMSMTSFFFLRFWREYVTNMSEKYPDFISVSKNFLADQSFAIFISLAESMMHGSEACEHFFGMARQINSDFNYSELLQLVPKISQCAKALRTRNITLEKEKSVRDGYHFDYNMGNISSSKLTKLCAWPSDTDITSTVKFSYKLAFELAKALDMKPTTNTNNSLLQPFVIIEEQNLEISTGINKSIIYLESANITQDFPLQQGDYVIVLYGMKICIAKVIAMYYEGYGNHCYSQNAVTQIEDLSYISLQVYLPIHLNIFASQTVEGYTLFTHHCPQNIIYHIKSNGVIIGFSQLEQDIRFLAFQWN